MMKAWLMTVPLLCLIAAAAEAQQTPKAEDKIKRQNEVQCVGREVSALQERIEKMPKGALKSVATDEVKTARDLMASGDAIGCTLRLRAAMNAVQEQGNLLPPPMEGEDGL